MSFHPVLRGLGSRPGRGRVLWPNGWHLVIDGSKFTKKIYAQKVSAKNLPFSPKFLTHFGKNGILSFHFVHWGWQTSPLLPHANYLD